MTEFDFKGALASYGALCEGDIRPDNFMEKHANKVQAALRLAARVQSGELVVVPRVDIAENSAYD